jgi:DNA (cytosine-5)-methyltransferase 1
MSADCLVLSLFPGIGLLDMAFELEGFCVVRGPDLLWGGDIRSFHPPAGRFDGVIGGPPCPAFSSAANIARAAGKRVKPDLIPEFARVVREAAPAWWLMENVEGAYAPFEPDERPSTVSRLDNRWVGGEQHRVRCFWSDIPLRVETVALEHIDRAPTAAMSIWKDGRQYGDHTEKRVREVVRLQGLDEGWDLPGFTVREKLHALVNGVPLPMGRAIAEAVKRAMGYDFPEKRSSETSPGVVA